MNKNFVLVMTLLLLASGCSDSGNNVVGDPPVSVAGEWVMTPLNAGQATLTGCTGPTTPLEGLTMQVVGASAVVCTTADPALVTQNGEVISYLDRSFSCVDGSDYVESGGGTVTGDLVQATTRKDWSFGLVEQNPLDGISTSPTTLSVTPCQRAGSTVSFT